MAHDGWGYIAGSAFIDELKAMGINFGAQEDTVRQKAYTIFQTAHNNATVESKKAALCYLLMVAMGKGEYGDVSRDPLRAVMESFVLCFDEIELDRHAIQQLWDYVDAAS